MNWILKNCFQSMKCKNVPPFRTNGENKGTKSIPHDYSDLSIRVKCAGQNMETIDFQWKTEQTESMRRITASNTLIDTTACEWSANNLQLSDQQLLRRGSSLLCTDLSTRKLHAFYRTPKQQVDRHQTATHRWYQYVQSIGAASDH